MDQVVEEDVFEVQLLTPEEIESYWPFISKELDLVPLIWDAWWTKHSLYSGAILGNFQVWAIGPKTSVRLILFTQVCVYPANRILQIVLAIGNSLDESLPIIDATLESWARAQECGIVEVIGREGWKKKLAHLGMRQVKVTMSKNVHNERIQ